MSQLKNETPGDTWQIDDLSAQVDGIGALTTFTTMKDYQAGKLAVFHNSVCLVTGVAEVTANTFTITPAPLAGGDPDDVVVHYAIK